MLSVALMPYHHCLLLCFPYREVSLPILIILKRMIWLWLLIAAYFVKYIRILQLRELHENQLTRLWLKRTPIWTVSKIGHFVISIGKNKISIGGIKIPIREISNTIREWADTIRMSVGSLIVFSSKIVRKCVLLILYFLFFGYFFKKNRILFNVKVLFLLCLLHFKFVCSVFLR